MADVICLPGAATAPVINPRRRGRYPANIHKMRTEIRAGDLAAITQGHNLARRVRVIGLDRQLSRQMGEDWWMIEAIGAPLRTTCIESGESSSSGSAVIDGVRLRRLHVRSGAAEPAVRAVPAWPARWAANLKAMQIGGAA